MKRFSTELTHYSFASVLAFILAAGAGLLGAKTTFAQPDCCRRDPLDFSVLSQDPEFIEDHLMPAAFVYKPTAGKMVEFETPDGKRGQAFEVRAKTITKNYLLVFHEWWGLNDYIKREAEKIQKELVDVNVLAIDLFDGSVASIPEEAAKQTSSADPERLRNIIRGAIGYAGEGAAIGTLGWCLGGQWALQASIIAGWRGRATVMYYGTPEYDSAKLSLLRGPVLAIFGTLDKRLTPEVAQKFKEAMDSAGEYATILSYEADHAFANPSNPAYNKPAATEAWKNARSFLLKNLLKKSEAPEAKKKRVPSKKSRSRRAR